MSSSEFAHWMAYESLEPFGPLVDDFRAGTIAAVGYNMARSSNAKAMGASDFMPALKAALNLNKPEVQDMTADQQIAFLDAKFGF